MTKDELVKKVRDEVFVLDLWCVKKKDWIKFKDLVEQSKPALISALKDSDEAVDAAVWVLKEAYGKLWMSLSCNYHPKNKPVILDPYEACKVITFTVEENTEENK